jgi:MFS family permease
LQESDALDAVPLSQSERRQSLAAAISCCAVFGITVAVMSPLISLILEGRGVDRTTIGAMASVPAIALIATNPFLPALVARFGLRPFLYGCLCLQLVLTLLMPLFDNLIAWFVLRGLMGAAVNGLFVISETWINAVAEERSRGRVLAIYGAVLSGSFALGPLMISIAGTEGWLPFVATAALIAMAGIPLLWTSSRLPVIQGRASFGVLSFFLVAPTLVAAVFLSAFKEMSMGALLPVYGVRSGLSESASAAMLTACYVGALLFQLPIGWLADRMNRYLLLILLMICGLVGTLLLPGIVSLGRPFMWLGLGLWIGLFSGTYIVAMTIVGERFRGADLVTANASFGFLWGLGILTGPFLSGTAMDIWDPDGFPGVLAAVTAIVLAVAITRRWQARRG